VLLPLAAIAQQAVPALEQVAEQQTGAVFELNQTAVLLTVMGVLIAFSVLFSRTIERLGIPIVLLFLILGMLGGSEGFGGIAFGGSPDDLALAVRLGTIALVLILFDGGLSTSFATVRAVLAPSAILATLGVVLTAALVMLFAMALRLPWQEAALLGAVVSSTDAAAVFALLRSGKLYLKPRVERTLEVESCVNDPMAVILTVTMIQVVARDQALSPWTAVLVPTQLIVGGLAGGLVGLLGRWLLRKLEVATVGLIPALTLSIAFLSFGVATLAWGSGFLSVYVTALVLGNTRGLPYRSGLVRVHDSFAWLAQIGMFLMLGLLVFPSALREVALIGLAVGLFLAFVARPLAVLACLLPFKYQPREVAYIGWAGLRGAVPIILATFPALAGVDGAPRIFNLVFFIVVVSAIVPGATLRPITRWAKLMVPRRPPPPAALEINAPVHLEGELLSFYIEPTLAVANAKLSELEFPSGSAVLLIVRKNELLVARGETELLPGDHVYIFTRQQDRPLIDLLFGQPEDESLL
jgi:cell volume regulation protein A